MTNPCIAEGCDRPARYKAQCLCQRHYFRLWRNGTTDLKPKRIPVPSFVGLGGYVFIHCKGHPLAGRNYYAREHRVVVYNDLGPGPMACELCGVEVTWETVHIDHINNIRTDNRRENLRPTCNPCNTGRGKGPAYKIKGNFAVTVDGETKTPAEWARDPRVQVAGTTIRHRMLRGQSAFDAVFGPKITHNGNKPVKKPRPPASTRKNAVNVTINGETMTSMEWSRHQDCKVTDGAIRMRVRLGWPPEAAVFWPPHKKFDPRHLPGKG